MSALLTKVFLDEPRLAGSGYRYGMLVFMLVLTIFSAIVVAHLPSDRSGRYFGVVVPPMLLLKHLAFQFRWPVPVTVALRAIALLSCGLGVGYTVLVMAGKW